MSYWTEDVEDVARYRLLLRRVLDEPISGMLRSDILHLLESYGEVQVDVAK